MSINILNGTDEFPYPTSIDRSDFQNSSTDDVDSFLFENHRFTSIDSLSKELEKLSITLNNDLVNLINSEYKEFVKLGNSINGGLELINMIKINLTEFKRDLIAAEGSLDGSQNHIEQLLNEKKELIILKLSIKLCLLLSNQITNFENILSLDTESTLKLQNLMLLYVSIFKLFSYVNTEANLDNQFISKILANKITSLKLSFKSYLDGTLKAANKNRLENTTLMMELMTIYKIIGHEADYIAIIKRK